jgi:hypothetical protein
MPLSDLRMALTGAVGCGPGGGRNFVFGRDPGFLRGFAGGLRILVLTQLDKPTVGFIWTD